VARWISGGLPLRLRVLHLLSARSAETATAFLHNRSTFRRGEKVHRACVECRAFLLCPIVPLVDPNYASPAPAQMIQHRLGDFDARAKALQPRRQCPAQIMRMLSRAPTLL
jgi:hypothetical protein